LPYLTHKKNTDIEKVVIENVDAKLTKKKYGKTTKHLIIM
jgi:hypothetical protein